MSCRKIFQVLALAFILLVTVGTFIYADQSEIEREIIAKFKSDIIQMPDGKNSAALSEVVISSPQVLAILSQYNPELILKGFPDYDPADSIAISSTGQIVRKPDFSEIYKIRLPEAGNREALINDLDTLSEVIYAELNGTVEFLSGVQPNDEYFSLQWGLYNAGQSGGTPGADIRAPEAWEIFTGSSDVKIGIIDAGVWALHPDLSGKVSGDLTYSNEHGTHVAGIAAAKTNNDSIGVAGTDWNAQIIAKDLSYCDLPGIATKITEAVDEGADVLNNSWRLTQGYSVTVRNSFAYAYKMNRAAVVSMGNEYLQGNPTNYPAAFGQGIMAVGATTEDDERSAWSSTGDHIDVVAPGGINYYPNNDQHDIYSTWVSGYRYLAGTSMAAPFVSGLASLLKGYNPDLYNDDIEQIIRISADTVEYMQGQEWTAEYGDGRIDARDALDLLRPPNCLAQWSASGAIYPSGLSDFYEMQFYSVPGLSDGSYHVFRYDVRQDISFAQPFSSVPYAWGRGVGSLGYSLENPNFGMGYCKVVDGSVTPTGCTLESSVYAVFKWNGGYIPMGFSMYS